MKNICIFIAMISWLNNISAQGFDCDQLSPTFAESVDNIYTNCIQTPVGVYHNDRQHSKNWLASDSINLSGIAPYLPTLFDPYNFQANIAPSPFVISLLEGNANAIELYGKAEFGIALPPNIASQVDNFVKNLSGSKINPYLEWEIKVQGHFFNGTTTNIDGFYYKEYIEENIPTGLPAPTGSDGFYTDEQYMTELGTWTEVPSSFPFRVRFSPPATGGWSVNFTVTTPDTTFTTPSYDFTVVNTGKKPPIEVDSNNRFLAQNGKTFIPSGCNLTWPEIDTIWNISLANNIGIPKSADYRAQLAPPILHKQFRDKMVYLSGEGANYFRFLMHPASSDIEFEHLGDYTGRLNLAWEMDQMLEHAENLGLYIQWNMLVHYPLCTLLNGSTFWDWENNNNGLTPKDTGYCYHTELNLASQADFFTNTDAIKYWKQRIRYIISRWGYSSNVSMFELMSEISNVGQYQNTGDGPILSGPYSTDANFRQKASDWESIMADYIKNELEYKSHLLTVGYGVVPVPPDVIYDDPNIDLRARDVYDNTVESVDFDYFRKGPADILASNLTPKKPYIFSEFGNLGGIDHCDNYVETNRSIWKAQFSGLASSTNWYAASFEFDWSIYGKISQFWEEYNMNGGNFHPGSLKLQTDEHLTFKQSWGKDMTRKDLKADLTYLRAGNQYRALGVITNRTWNYYTESEGTCGSMPFPKDDSSNFIYASKQDVSSIKSSLNGHNNKLKVRGMEAKKYYIYYYDPTSPTVPLDVPFTNDSYQTEWGPKLNLEYPTLTGSATMPFVLFKIVRADGSSVNPAMQLDDNRTLASEQLLVKDSIAQQVSLENGDTVRVQNENDEIKLYPNPTSNFVNLEIENWRENSYYYTIFNNMGQIIVNNGLIKEKLTRIDVSNFQKGVYQIEVISKDNVVNLQLVLL